MTKKTPSIDPIAVAESVHARFCIERPSDLKIELMAYHYEAYALARDAGAADARVVRVGTEAYLAVAKDAWGTPRARFSIAHELGHHLMHPDFDAIERIHGKTRLTEREHAIEGQANRFASIVLVPTFLARERCLGSKPTLAAVGELAREFDVSLTVAARRWAEIATAPCAFVESRGGRIKDAVRSSGFRGVAVRGRKLEPGSLALDMLRTRERNRAHRVAWGADGDDVRDLVEECVSLGEGGKCLSWLRHA